MQNSLRHIFLLFLLVIGSGELFAQKKTPVEIIKAEYMEYIKTPEAELRKLVGNVQLKQNEMLLYCDSALLNQAKNQVEAFGNVRIIQGDSLFISGDSLKYFGNEKRASLNGNVSLREKNMWLRTPQLNYNLDTKVATYTQGAELQNEGSTLTSKIGYYHSTSKNAYFRGDVVLKNKDYDLVADTLMYNIDSKITYFYGPTTITSRENIIYTEGGWYNTVSDIAFFKKNVVLRNPPQTISGDSIYYDRNSGIGKAYSNVSLVDTAQNIIINSHLATFYERENTMVATDQALMTNIIDGDSLFLTADTLRSVEDTISKIRELFAYNNVKIYKRDLQGVCDSLTYSTADSILNMYYDPIIWSDSSQLTGDTIFVYLKDEKIDRIDLRNNAFLGTMDDTLIYNQVKGKYITGYFKDDTLRNMLVDGNGTAIYYLEDDAGAYIGINRTECSRMNINFLQNKVDRINCTGTPGGTMHPIQKVVVTDFILEGFRWRSERRPRSKEALLAPEGPEILSADKASENTEPEP